VNVFDFDKTIYDGDSTVRFYMFELRQHPRLWLGLPRVVGAGALYGLRIWPRDRFKAALYASFLPRIDVTCEVKDFWAKEQHRIKPWYLKLKQPSDLISSASPEFLIQPIGKILGVSVHASKVDTKTGRLLAANNRDHEKVKRFKSAYKNEEINQFYSDSLADTPLAKLAKEAFIVRGNNISPWPPF
jgi:phosphoserine phosphatase